MLARPLTLPPALAALSVPSYRLWLSSQLIATTGVWMQRIAQDWLVLKLTGSVAAVGIAVALQFLPVLTLGLFGGVIADRYAKRTLLIITQASAAALALTLGLLAVTGTVRAWQVFLIAGLLGLVTVVDNPTRQVFVTELVGEDHMRNAISLNSSVFQFGALVGPGLSGFLINAVGQGWSFLINSAACTLVVIMVAVIRPTKTQPARPAVKRQRPQNPPGQLREGLRYIGRTSEIGWTIALVATMGVFGLNMPVILAAFADHEFRTGVSGYSLYNVCAAVGALSGALISARRTATPRLRVLVMILTVQGGILMLGSTAAHPWMLCVTQVVGGLLTLLFLTGANSLVQTTAAPWLRGRVMSVYILVLLGGQSVGSPAVGWLVDRVGVRPSMFLCGGLVTLVTLAAGVAMARKSHLEVEVDLRREHGRSPLHIVHS